MAQFNAEHAMELASSHHRAGRLPEAEQLYRQILAQKPDHVDALHKLGVLAAQQRRGDLAVELIGKAVALKPDFAQGHVDLANVLAGLGKFKEAIAAYRQALHLQPQNAEAWNRLGIALASDGEVDQAVEAYRQAIAGDPRFSAAYNNLGLSLREKGQLDESIAAYRQAIALSPKAPEIHNNLGMVLKSTGRVDEAIACYRQALALNPTMAKAHNNLGNSLKEKGQIDAAISHLRQAIAIMPELAAAHYNLGVALQRKGLLKEAEAEIRQAIGLKPNSADWRYYLAALCGDGSVTTTPPQYVRDLFDGYAPIFDKHLVEELKYGTPHLMFEGVREAAPERQFDVLDLGCGTGLCGVEFRPLARRMVGVDLSPKMLKLAEQRKIYDQLILGELVHELRRAEKDFDLIVAADVLNYVGDLSQFMPAAAKALRVGGLLACSIENYEGTGFFLHSESRFAHSVEYFRELASTSGLREVSAQKATIRQNYSIDVSGWILVYALES